MKLFLLIILGLEIAFVLPDISFSEQKELYGSLFQISSIILGITGVWSAIVYPNSLKEIFKKNDSKDNLSEINALIKPMLNSLLIIGVLIAIQLTSFFIDKLTISQELLKIAQFVNLGIIIGLYFFQIGTIILAFLPISDAKEKASYEDKINDALDKA